MFTAFFKYFNLILRNIFMDLYIIVVKVAEFHFRFVDHVIEIFIFPLKPVFAPYARYFYNNYPLKFYIVYLISIVLIIGFFFYWEPYFFYIFIYFELFAFFVSAILHNHSYLVRRAILLFFFGLAMIDVFADWAEPVILLHEFLSFFSLADSFNVIGTHLCLQELVDGYHFWLYYFAVFFAPYLALTVAIFAPLVSFFFAFCFGYLIGYRLIGYVSSFFIFLSFIGASYILLFYPIFRQEFINLVFENRFNFDSYFNLINLNELINIDLYKAAESSSTLGVYLDFGVFLDTPFIFSCFDLGVDSIGAIFVFIVTFISFLVHLYSIEYMQNDPHTVRFFGLLSFFTFSMLVLVTSADLIILFIGWEGVGLSSFLLISFWYTRVPALKSALKAILMNKIGDMFLLFAIVIMGYFAGGDMSIALAAENVTQELISSKTVLWGFSALDLTAILLTLAAFVKSAQLFFHTWLPDAMEGPTPVSALLHAATMVTAGVYLVIRFSFIIELSYTARLLMLIVSSWTLVVTSLIALFQYDIKKIIAYSTCGQLAMMFIACSLSGYDYALFHFFNHAFFKCLLFLLAGLIIHDLKNEQDIRAMGNLSSVMPYTFYAFTLAMISSIGFPFLSGACSKDLILALLDEKIIEASFDFTVGEFNYIFYVIYFLKIRFAMVVLTSLYMLRLYYYVFLCFPNYRKNIFNKRGYVEPIARSWIYSFVVSVLVILSLSSGKIFKNLFIVTECNYIDIHNDILSLNTDTVTLACNYHFHYVTHLTLLGILIAAGFYFSWLKTNGHISFLLTAFNFLKRFNDAINKDTTFWQWNPEPSNAPRTTLEVPRMPPREVKKRIKFIKRYLRPLDWSIKIFRFFNKKCYFDDLYNYFIVYSIVVSSNYIRVGCEKGVFLFLADQLAALVQKISAMSGYIMPKGFLVNLLFIFIFFVTIWFWF